MMVSPRLPETIRTIPEALAFWAERTPHAPALIVPRKPVITCADLYRGVMTLAASLGRAGFGRDDRIIVLVPEGPDLAVALLGTMSAAVAVPLDAALPDAELAVALDGLHAAGAVVTSALTAEARDCLTRFGVATFAVDPDDLRRGAGEAGPVPAPAPPFAWPRPGDVAVVSQTSGTTGRPKRVPRIHERLVESGRRHRDRFGLDRRDRALAVAPLTVSMGRTALLHGIAAGSALLFPASADLGDHWDAIATACPTWMLAPAGFLELLARWLRGEAHR